MCKRFFLCRKNSHIERLKYPYFQKVKGSGKFVQITWEKAYQLLIHEMVNIHKYFNRFLPISYLKGSGNIGVHHFVVDEFFSSLGEITKITSSSALFSENDFTKKDALNHFHPQAFHEASLILIWGANPAATNIHLIPFLIEAKLQGAKIVVIDPIYTQTVELADLYIQLRPGSDAVLAALLINHILDGNVDDKCECVELNEQMQNIDVKEYSLFTFI